jgi:hypothetical protein
VGAIAGEEDRERLFFLSLAQGDGGTAFRFL